ncbi:sialoadhesin-like isoform X2 [Chelmon rostratus]|uniref:sialoadhesin-like isoform X2 n=1 Tax=Chelmon rostratus TaxID=109905 RepID=UPI001BE6C20E|nr:sialoadhesin-like isoform X2 [Chelmon rostratus]
MSSTAAASGFVAFLLSVQVVQGTNDWGVTYTSTEICASKGSTVELPCTYKYPSRQKTRYTTVTNQLWFTEFNGYVHVDLRTDPQYSGRVEYSDDKKDCTLTITDVRESDSAEYKFRFITNHDGGSYTGSPGVTLWVTDPGLQVKVRESPYRDQIECHIICHRPDHPSYIWYKNGQKIPAATSSSSYYYSDSFSSADSYSCAVAGHEDSPSPSVCVVGQSCNRVTYTHRGICVFRGSSVDISCTYSSNGYDVDSKFWFSPERSRQWLNPSQPEDLGGDSQYDGRVQVITERGRSTLRITDLTESDSAQYRFKFRTGSFEWTSSLPGTTLTVTALQVQVTRIKVYQSYTEAELKCHSSCGPAGRSSWFKNGEEITGVQMSSYKGVFYPGDIISCALKGHETYVSPSVYAPKPPSVSVSHAGKIMEGSSVTLTCSSDANPAASYTWYKENVNLKAVREEAQLVFRSIQSSDSGEYYCAAENELGRRTSKNISIEVTYAPKLPSVLVSPSGEIEEGSSVTLSCSSDANPAAKYTWYKMNQTLTPGDTYHFTSITLEDSGIYHCKSENEYGQITSNPVHIDVQYAPKLPSVSVSPSGEIKEGSSVTLTCSSDANPAANYTWYRENEDSTKASGQIFIITDFRAEHSGNYYCEAQSKRGRRNSTLYLLAVAGKSTMMINIIRLTLVVVGPTLLLLFCLWMRKKKTLSSTTETHEPIETMELESDPDYTNVSALNSRRRSTSM